MIPRIIHQTWKDNNLPPDFKLSKESWQQMHPGWTYILWTDEMNRNLIATDFPWFLEYYDNYEYNIQRADAIRYFILWKYGGIYSDLDVLATKCFETVLTDMENKDKTIALVSSGNLDSHASNWLMISTRYNSFWKEVWRALVDSYQNKNCSWCFGKHLKVMYSTGPGMINAVSKNSSVSVLLLNDGFNPCSVCDPKPCGCEDCYIAHMTGQSWNEWDSLLLNKMLCNWQYAVLLILVIMVVLIMIYPCSA